MRNIMGRPVDAFTLTTPQQEALATLVQVLKRGVQVIFIRYSRISWLQSNDIATLDHTSSSEWKDHPIDSVV
jgi:hypothetical protein